MKDPIRYLGNWECVSLEEVLSHMLHINYVKLSTVNEVLND